MGWEISFIFLVIFGIGSSFLTKALTDVLPKKTLGIFYQFLFSAMLALAYVLFSGGFSFDISAVIIGFMGIFNAIASYYFWKATESSLSQTTLFLPLVDIVAVILALIILREAKTLNPLEIVGIALCFVSMGIFKSSYAAKNKTQSRWLYYIFVIVIIGGVSTFLLKIFSSTVSHQTFLASWYGGSFLGSIFLMITLKENPLSLELKNVFVIFPLSICVVGALLALYRVFELGGSVSVVLPLKNIFGTIIPIFIGWFFFHENKKFVIEEYIAFALGILGIIFILII